MDKCTTRFTQLNKCKLISGTFKVIFKCQLSFNLINVCANPV
jgi:hypothetical protein